MMMSMTRLFHNITQNLQDQDQDHSLQDQDRFFLVSDRSCPKTTVSDHITGISTAPKPQFFSIIKLLKNNLWSCAQYAQTVIGQRCWHSGPAVHAFHWTADVHAWSQRCADSTT